MIVITLSGNAGCGKDTAAKFMKEFLEEQGYETELFAYADAVKECARFIGWNGEKDERGRKVLQIVGTEVGRNLIDENLWVNKVMDKIKNSTAEFCIITDARFPANEIEIPRKIFGEDKVIAVKIERVGMNSRDNHPSETLLNEYYGYNHIIFNFDKHLDFFKDDCKLLCKAIIG